MAKKVFEEFDEEEITEDDLEGEEIKRAEEESPRRIVRTTPPPGAKSLPQTIPQGYNTGAKYESTNPSARIGQAEPIPEYARDPNYPPTPSGKGGRPSFAQQEARREAEARSITTSPEPDKFMPYSIPQRVGIIDNEKKQPLLESGDVESLILMALTNILERLERIEKSL